MSDESEAEDQPENVTLPWRTGAEEKKKRREKLEDLENESDQVR